MLLDHCGEEMSRFLVAKVLGSLRPVDEAGEEVLSHLAHGEIIEITMRRPRNVQHHRLFFALMSLVWQQLDHTEYPTVEDLVTRMKIATGHRDRIEFAGGIVAFVPRSISFANMGQDEFTVFFEQVCDWVAKEILPGVTREDLRLEVEAMIGVR